LSVRPIATKPTPRVSTSRCGPSAFASERPRSGVEMVRSVPSPNSSAMSHTGTGEPMSPTVPSTGRRGTPQMPNGTTSSEFTHSTVRTSGRAS
jgi:hypothetical protein